MVNGFLYEKQVPIPLERNDRFSQSVAVFADSLVVGARDAEARDEDSAAISNTGAVYVCKRAKKSLQWILNEMITTADGCVSDGQYRFALAFSGHSVRFGRLPTNERRTFDATQGRKE
jgi:hypothetical protein